MRIRVCFVEFSAYRGPKKPVLLLMFYGGNALQPSRSLALLTPYPNLSGNHGPFVLFSTFVLATIPGVYSAYSNEYYSNFIKENCQESVSHRNRFLIIIVDDLENLTILISHRIGNRRFRRKQCSGLRSSLNTKNPSADRRTFANGRE